MRAVGDIAPERSTKPIVGALSDVAGLTRRSRRSDGNDRLEGSAIRSPQMITAGVDLAAQPERTAACRIEWASGRGVVLELVARGVDDGGIVDLIEGSERTGLDVPLG